MPALTLQRLSEGELSSRQLFVLKAVPCISNCFRTRNLVTPSTGLKKSLKDFSGPRSSN